VAQLPVAQIWPTSPLPPLAPRSKRDCDSVASSDDEDEDFGGGGGVGRSGGEQDEEMQCYWDGFDEDDSVNNVEDGSLHSLGGGINILMGDDNSVNSMEFDNSSDENLHIIENHLTPSEYEIVPDSDDVAVADWNIPLRVENPFYLLEDGVSFDAASYFKIENGCLLNSALYFKTQHQTKSDRKDIVKRCFFAPKKVRGIFLGSERCKEVHKRVKKLVDEKLRQIPELLSFVHGQMVSECTPSLPTTSITTFKCSLSD
jgi:hypothetical protein